MTRDEAARSIQTMIDLVEGDHKTTFPVAREALAALRAAPPAPAPELVALVQDMSDVVDDLRRDASSWRENGRQAGGYTETTLLREALENEAWADRIEAWAEKLRTPAAPVEPPARPETQTRCPGCPCQCHRGAIAEEACVCYRPSRVARPETAAPTPAPTRETANTLVEQWRKQADTHENYRHGLSDPYGDIGHVHQVKAKRLRQCADELAAVLSSPVGALTDAHKRAAERLGALAVPVPMSEAEKLPDPDYGLSSPVGETPAMCPFCGVSLGMSVEKWMGGADTECPNRACPGETPADRKEPTT